MSSGAPAADPPGIRWRAMAVLIAAALFMENLDATVIATAAPAMARSLGSDAASIGAAIAVYLTSVAAFVPLSGWLSERFGVRRVLLTAVALFTVASALCAASTSVLELVAFRAGQGIGGAMMVPVGQLWVLRSIPDRSHLFSAVALLTWPALIAPVVAPLLGGALATYASWRWIFLINFPIGIAVFAAGFVLMERPTAAPPPALDVTGFLYVSTGLVLLTTTTTMLSAGRPRWGLCAITGAACVLVLGAAVRHLRASANPLLELNQLRIPTMHAAFVTGGMFRLAVSGVPFLLPLLFQEAFGWSAVRAGATVLWLFAGNLAAKVITTPLLRRWRYRVILRVSTAILTTTVVAAAFVRPRPLWVVIVLLVVSGAARSVVFTCLNTIAFVDVPVPKLAAANTVAATVGQLAAGLGVSLAATALHLGVLLPHADAIVSFRIAFAAIAVVSVVPLVSALRAAPDLGQAARPSW